jgi:hypothetical protein
MRTLFAAAGALAILTMAAAPADAHSAAWYRHHHYRDYRGSSACQRRERSSGTTGAVVGGIGGAVAGNAIGHGSLGGTLLGAGAGALIGHKVGQDSHNC